MVKGADARLLSDDILAEHDRSMVQHRCQSEWKVGRFIGVYTCSTRHQNNTCRPHVSAHRFFNISIQHLRWQPSFSLSRRVSL